MAQPVDFYFDYASPFAYVASETAAERLAGVELRYKPIYLRGFPAFSEGPPFTPEKLRYMTTDLHRCAEHAGVEIALPTVFPINALYLLRGALWAQANGCFETYHPAAFRAAWAEDRNVADKAVVIDLAAEIGLDRDAFTAGIEDPALKDRLKTQTAEAAERGAFGVPTFFVGDEMYWGQDRMDFVRRAALGDAAAA